MIGSIRGKLLENNGNYGLIETTGGVGYQVALSSETASELFTQTNQEVFLYIYTVVREDTLDLYGFKTAAEKDFFEKVIAVSGIGPKSGLAIVSVAPLNQLKSAIASGDTSFLTKVSGVGKKSAQKIVLELQDKLSAELLVSGETDSNYHQDTEVLQALISLGYREVEIRAVIKSLDPEIIGTEARLKAALKALG